MVSNSEAIEEAQKSVALKVGEPAVDADRPWKDDLLNRHEIATRLTNLVANQEAPLTVSLHGQWGTGKTFMLRRWQKDLESEKNGYRAIYFNAWEDDFCDDPLLAFIGQLSDHFKESGYKALARRVVDVAIPLIKENLNQVVKTKTGITFKVEQFKNRRNTLVDNYNKERATKEELKKALTDLSAQVAKDTSHPLVFIVDELDRCRPTFAIELLERVKHIFDVPNIVFVFGLNRDELCKSLTSVYGDIDADVYLRRFFEFEFNLPEAGSEQFARTLMDKYDLVTLSQKLMEAGDPRFSNHLADFIEVCPKLWSALSMSLRDIDYAIRLLALLARNLQRNSYASPSLLALLIGIKFKRPDYYNSMVSGDFEAKEIIGYINERSRLASADWQFAAKLDRIEGYLYRAERVNQGERVKGARATEELRMAREGKLEGDFHVISERAKNRDLNGLDGIEQAIKEGQHLGIDERIFVRLAALIDIYQADLRG